MQTDKEEFLQLIEENKGIIFKICNSYCRDKSEREDLGQEIVYQLWKSGKNFDANHKFSTWMYRVALNTAISFYRKEKNAKANIFFIGNIGDIKDENTSNSIEVKINMLQQFIHELNELDKSLMILYLEEKSYAEIADILGITETNVATKINRIKIKLKQRFITSNID